MNPYSISHWSPQCSLQRAQGRSRLLPVPLLQFSPCSGWGAAPVDAVVDGGRERAPQIDPSSARPRGAGAPLLRTLASYFACASGPKQVYQEP
ncbi:unnamed protein product [Arctogadus glacialis]